MKLLVSEYEVEMANENSNAEFMVKFHGPKESPYEGVSWYNKVDYLSLLVYAHHHYGIGNVESKSHITGVVPIQISIYRLRKSNLSPEHWWSVRSNLKGLFSNLPLGQAVFVSMWLTRLGHQCLIWLTSLMSFYRNCSSTQTQQTPWTQKQLLTTWRTLSDSSKRYDFAASIVVNKPINSFLGSRIRQEICLVGAL